MKGRSFHTYKDFLFLFLLAILAYWPVSFMLFSAKGDAINYFLAMRYNTSEALQHGYFPYWTAYINLGYPLHGDIQSGVWNPVVLLMSLLRQYDIYWLHTEIILIIFIAGAGMYGLLKYFRFERKTILVMASAYMLNGYITDAGQFLNWLYAAAFLPWVFLYLLKTFSSFNARDAFGLGVAHALMFLCAYPADSILLSYIILAYVIISLVQFTRKQGWSAAIRKHTYVSIITILTLVIICLPAILSFVEFIPLINRGEGVALADAMVNSLAPANLLSVVMPWPTMKGAAFAATDPLIRNCYMGLLSFVFLCYYFLSRQKKDITQQFLVGVFIIFLFFSFGNMGGLRFISYHILPLMDSFRHPANAKLFFLFAGQVLAAVAINRYLVGENINKTILKKIIIGVLIGTGIAFIISVFNTHIFSIILSAAREGNLALNTVLKNIRDQLSFYDLLLLNSFFILLVSGTAYLLFKKDRLSRYLIPLACIDLFITAQFMLPLTYVKKAPAAEIQAILNQQPKGYPLPDANTSLAEYSEGGELYFDKIGCLNPYNKKPGRSGYIITPSNPATQDQFWDYIAFREKVMNNPLAYFADTIFATRDTAAFLADNSLRRPAVADNMMVNTTGGNDSASILIKKFLPGHFVFETNSNHTSIFVLLQNYYPRWRVYINDHPARIERANLSFMGVEVPAGKNTISFVYKARHLGWLGLFSVIFVMAGSIFFYFIKRKKKSAN